MEIFVRKLQEEAEQLFQEYIATPRQLPALNTYATNCWEGTKYVFIVTLWGNVGVLRIVGVIYITEYQSVSGSYL